MADNSKEEFLQLVKRFGAFLTLKISNLFQRLVISLFLCFLMIFFFGLSRFDFETRRRVDLKMLFLLLFNFTVVQVFLFLDCVDVMLLFGLGFS